MNPQAYMMKLICHAPAIPEWFKPIGKFPWDRRLTEDEQLEKRFFEWPSYYAKTVLEAAGIKEEQKLEFEPNPSFPLPAFKRD